MIGLMTRLAAVLQLPVIIAAFFYNLIPSAFGSGAQLLLSVVLFILLVAILYKGSGPISIDRFVKRHKL